MPDGLVQDLGDRRKAVGGAGCVRDHLVIGAQALVVDTIDDGVVGAGGRGRDQHALGAGLKVLRGGVTAGEAAGALHDDIDVKLAPRQLGRIGLGGHLDCATVEHNAVAIDLDRPREATVDGNRT